MRIRNSYIPEAPMSVPRCFGVLHVLGAVVLIALIAGAATIQGSLTFTNTPLIRPEGDSEPAISIGPSSTMAITGLRWLAFGTNLWTGPTGSTPTYRGVVDAALQQPGRTVLGGGDADVDLGSTGTLHETSLIFLVNKPFVAATLGVAAVTCPNGTSSSFSISTCTSQVLDKAGVDRQWISSEHSTVYISYHDSANSSLIHVQRSDDDGYTWQKVGDPIVGQGRLTGFATFNNTQGPIAADPHTGNVYTIYAAGEPSVQKGTSAAFNNILVSRSTDKGLTWTATVVFHAPLFTDFSNVFPALAVDPTSGNLYAVWSDAHHVFFSQSLDQGSTWSPAVAVNAPPAVTAIFPWVAAYSGTVDVVYYGTSASSKDESTAIWNVYLAQTTNGGTTFSQNLVSNTSNHVGVICTSGTGCASGTRNLLDLFEVAINPQTGLASVIYTDDTLTKTTSGKPLPQIVLAQQNP
jgi:hypothetical protein